MFKRNFKHSLILIAFSIVAFVLLGCGSSDSTPTSTKKYLARNVIFNYNLVGTAYAAQVDTETKIPAENVVFEKTSNSAIESDNVQDALEEISLKLSEVIIGTWNIENYNHENLHEDTGKTTINADGTFNLTEGSFAAIGMGSDPSFCDHTEDNQTYQFFTDEVVLFTHYNPSTDPPTKNAAIPRLVKLRQSEIIFVGSGGCGSIGQERISVLNRVAE